MLDLLNRHRLFKKIGHNRKTGQPGVNVLKRSIIHGCSQVSCKALIKNIIKRGKQKIKQNLHLLINSFSYKNNRKFYPQGQSKYL